jgi:hypothetical protein
MELHLNEEEAGELARLLDRAVTELGDESAGTDRFRYRSELREERELVTRLRDRVRAAAPRRLARTSA